MEHTLCVHTYEWGPMSIDRCQPPPRPTLPRLFDTLHHLYTIFPKLFAQRRDNGGAMLTRSCTCP